MRVRKKKRTVDVLKNSQRIVSTDFNVEWEKYFGNGKNICLEIGCGKGKFINQMALEFKNKNFVAMEICPDIVISAIEKAEKNNLTNIFFIVDNAKNLEKYFLRGQVGELYINFCDPWPKKKHAKRRLTHKNFLDIYKKILMPTGKIFFKTDNKDLFDFSIKEFLTNGFGIKNICNDLHKKNFGIENIETEYEGKFLILNMPIFYCEAFLTDN